VTEDHFNALQTIIDEFKNISPETKNALIFKSNGQTMAKTQTTTEDQTKKLITNFNNIAQQTETIGGVENLTIQATDSQLNITAMNNFYLATVSSRAANQEIVKSLTHVIIPTVAQLVDQLSSLPKESHLPESIQLENTSNEETILQDEEKPNIEIIPEPQPPLEPFLPKTPINQFMVEKIGGLLIPADLVRIDGEVITRWSDIYEGKQITMVNIETLDGNKTTCKFKAIKDAKSNARGIIQIPEKILQTLQTEKGKLVIVKPVIE
jgi:hypothetical protein